MNNFNDSLSTPKHKQQPLQKTFTKIKNQQNTYFQTINNKCTFLQDSIYSLQNTLSNLQIKLKNNIQNNTTVKLAQMRDRQKQFIINQLENKVKRLEEYEENVHIILMEKQSIINQLQDKCEQYRVQNVQIKQEIIKKTKQIKQLIKTNTSLKLAQSIQQSSNQNQNLNTNKSKQVSLQIPIQTSNLSELGIKKQQVYIQNQHYTQLEQKLREMQDCLNEQIQQYKLKNQKLVQQITGLQKQLKKQTENSKKIYQLQFKIKNLMNENKQLEQSYTNQVALNNANEIKFHKKINQMKIQIQDAKKITKNMAKQVQKQLLRLCQTILGANKSTIFIGVPTLAGQFTQLSKQILKHHKKQNNSITYEKDTQIQQLKINLQNSKTKIKQLNATVEKIKSSKNQKNDKSIALNGNSMSNKSNSRTDIQNKEKDKQKQKQKQKQKEKQKQKANNQRIQKLQQKYQLKIKQLRLAIQQKEKQVNDLRKKHDEEQNLYSKRILQLEGNLAQKQMQIKYQQQKFAQAKKSEAEINKQKLENFQQQIKRCKQKIKEIELQRQQFKAKYRQSQQKTITKQKLIRQLEKRQKQSLDKLNKNQKKHQQKHDQNKRVIQSKNKTIEQLITKNQNIQSQTKVLKQKLKISQFNFSSMKQISVQAPRQEKNNFQQIQNQLILQKQSLQLQINRKAQQIQQFNNQIEQKNKQISKKQQKIDDLNSQLRKYENQNKLFKNQAQSLKQTIQKLKQSGEKGNNFSQLKQQYEKREKLLKTEGQKIISQMKATNKQIIAQNKKLNEQITYLKQNIQSLKNQINLQQQQKLKINCQKLRDTQRERNVVSDYQKKIQQLSSKIAQLTHNSEKNQNIKKIQQRKAQKTKKLFKGTQSVQYVQFGVVTDQISKNDKAINTIDIFALQTQQNKGMNRILDLGDDQVQVLGSNNQNQQQELRNSNLFVNLNHNAPTDDVFQICDEEQQVNFGQSSMNLQFRQIFTSLRIEIEKLFNQEQISFGISKLLPQPLQDDYYQLMSYIKQKIAQQKVHNQISFIMAQPGNQPDLENSLQLPNILDRRLSQGNQNLHKLIQQKQAMIHSLMNQRTSQQNTINQLTMQKQEMQQQNENRFMNQCNVYKRQIKQHKKNIDILQMNFQSMKNIIRNVLQAFSQNQDMEDDFRQSMTLYARVGQLTQKQRSKINYYIQRYLQIKGLDQDQ